LARVGLLGPWEVSLNNRAAEDDLVEADLWVFAHRLRNDVGPKAVRYDGGQRGPTSHLGSVTIPEPVNLPATESRNQETKGVEEAKVEGQMIKASLIKYPSKVSFLPSRPRSNTMQGEDDWPLF